MGTYQFKLPDIGEGIAEAEIVAWHIKVGDRVEEDQQLADMMTDKATVEMESPVAGVVKALAGEVGLTGDPGEVDRVDVHVRREPWCGLGDPAGEDVDHPAGQVPDGGEGGLVSAPVREQDGASTNQRAQHDLHHGPIRAPASDRRSVGSGRRTRPADPLRDRPASVSCGGVSSRRGRR